MAEEVLKHIDEDAADRLLPAGAAAAAAGPCGVGITLEEGDDLIRASASGGEYPPDIPGPAGPRPSRTEGRGRGRSDAYCTLQSMKLIAPRVAPVVPSIAGGRAPRTVRAVCTGSDRKVARAFGGYADRCSPTINSDLAAVSAAARSGGREDR